MTDMIDDADGDLGEVWDALHLANGTAENAEYGMWASRTCNEGAQRRVGIDDVEVDGHTAADLWLRVGGTYNVDLSLGSREQFVAGDVATVCSLAWYDDIRRAASPRPARSSPACCIRDSRPIAASAGRATSARSPATSRTPRRCSSPSTVSRPSGRS